MHPDNGQPQQQPAAGSPPPVQGYPPPSGYPQPGYPQAPGFATMPPMPAPPPPPGPQPVDSALRLVLILMFVNLGLSVVLTILLLILHTSVIDFQLAHTNIPPGSSPQVVDAVHTALQSALWGRLAGVLVVSLFYVIRARGLLRGNRRSYTRMIIVAVIGLLGIAYLILGGQYPVWMRIEQGLQAVVLIGLLVALLRPPVRGRFANR